jgi:hypothetical protein
LLDELHEEMETLWSEYAVKRDEVLTERAKELRSHLVKNLREEKVAAGVVEAT